MDDPSPHSAEQFGTERDHWWNPDFFGLLCSRWGLRGRKSVADIGCGLGCWSALLLGALDPGSRLVAVDREEEWVRRAGDSIRARLDRPDDFQFDVVHGDALDLPLADDTFDVVAADSRTEDRPLDDLVEEYRFWLCVHRGRTPGARFPASPRREPGDSGWRQRHAAMPTEPACDIACAVPCGSRWMTGTAATRCPRATARGLLRKAA